MLVRNRNQLLKNQFQNQKAHCTSLISVARLQQASDELLREDLCYSFRNFDLLHFILLKIGFCRKRVCNLHSNAFHYFTNLVFIHQREWKYVYISDHILSKRGNTN